MAKPRILLWDIETTHNVVAKFSLREEYVPHTNIIQERYIVSAAWKILGDPKVHSVSVLDDPERYAKNPHDDFYVVQKLHLEMEKADLIVAHNGDKFDTRWLAGRILFHNLPPLPPIPSIDTYKVAKHAFDLNSYRLDYIGKYLGLGGKKSTPPGLWLKVLQGDRKAIETMLVYNRRDVRLLEDVFKRLRGFVPAHLNLQLIDPDHKGCPRCGSTQVQSRGEHRSITQVYQRFQCVSCGGWFRLRKADKNRTVTNRNL